MAIGRRRRGFLLVLSLAVGSLLILMSGGLVQGLSTHLGFTRYGEDLEVSRAAADAAMLESIYQVSVNPAWSAPSPLVLARSGGSATTTVVNNNSGVAVVTAPDGRKVPPGCVYIASRGMRGKAFAPACALITTGQLMMDSEFTTNAAGWTHVQGLLPTVLLGQLVVGVNLPLTPQEQWEAAGHVTWKDYRVDVDATITTGTGIGVFVMGDANLDNAYMFEYSLLHNALDGGSFMVRKVVNGVVQEPLALVPRNDTPHGGLLNLLWLLNLKRRFSVIVRRDGNMEFLVDNISVLKVQDTWRTEGRIGLHGTLNTVALVDRVTVTSNFQVIARW